VTCMPSADLQGRIVVVLADGALGFGQERENGEGEGGGFLFQTRHGFMEVWRGCW